MSLSKSLFLHAPYPTGSSSIVLRQWVIADVHGCYLSLRSLVENKIQLNKSDRLFLLGDYIDRGAYSKEVLDYILQLRQEGYRIEPLIGNHEDVLLRCFQEQKGYVNGGFYSIHDSWLHFGGKQTLKSFGVRHASEIPSKYLDFLSSLPHYILTEDFALVHAGINFDLQDPLSDRLSMLWIKKFDPQAHKIGGRTVVHGHVPKSLAVIEAAAGDPEAKVIPLDNGCYFGPKADGQTGNLTAFELNTRKLLIQANIEQQSTVYFLQKHRAPEKVKA